MSAPLLRRWTPRIAGRLCRARLDRIDKALIEIAGLWGDVDQTVIYEVDSLRGEIEALRATIEAAVELQLDPTREELWP